MGGKARKGKKMSKTLEKLRVEAGVRNRILSMADKLLNSQAIAAIGTHRMVVLSFDEEGKKHIETVRDETRMQNLLDNGVYGEDYLILEGTKADWKAADALLTRVFGKPKESLEVNHTFSLVGLAERRKGLEPLTLPTPVPFREIEAP